MSAAIVVNGAGGRMGRLVAAALRAAALGSVAGHAPSSGATSLDLEDGPLPLVTDLVSGLEPGGVIVDFSRPAATADLVAAVRERQARLVVGTTGQAEKDLEALREAAARVPVLLARNFSLGLNRLLQILPQLRILLEDGFDVECLEAHHRHKRDAPSGTAQLLLDTLLGHGSTASRVHGRCGAHALRQPGEVGVHSLRLGGVAGEHAILFASDHEVIEVRHRALDRGAFVSGVVPAIRFVRSRPAGLYSMLDVVRHAASAIS